MNTGEHIVCMRMVTEQRYMHVSNWECRRWHRRVLLSSLFGCANKGEREWLKKRQNLPFAQPSNLVAFLIHHACGQRPQAFIVTLNCGFGVSVIRILWRSDVVMGKKNTPSSQSSIRGCCCWHRAHRQLKKLSCKSTCEQLRYQRNDSIFDLQGWLWWYCTNWERWHTNNRGTVQTAFRKAFNSAFQVISVVVLLL